MKFTVHAELIWLIGHLWLLVPVTVVSIFILVFTVFILGFLFGILFIFASLGRLRIILSLTCNW